MVALEAASAEAVASSTETGASAEAVRRGVLDARQRLPSPNLASSMARHGGTSLTDKMMRGTRGPRGGGLDPEMDFSYSAG